MIPLKRRLGGARFYTLFVFAFAVLLILLPLSHMFARPLPYIYNDEFGYWATAARIRGYDWSGVFQHISYYGYGYGVILSLFLFLFQDTGAAYIGAVGLNAVWLVGAYACLLAIAKRMAPERSPALRAFLAFACTVYSNNVTQSFYTWPENFLFFLFCLIVYLLYTIREKPTHLKCLLLGLLCAYSYVVHQRTIGILAAVGVAMLWFLLTRELKRSHFLCFMAVFCAGFALALAVRGDFIAQIWQNGTAANSNNMAGQVGKLQLLASVQGVKQLLLSMSGKLLYLICSTGFLILWAVERLLRSGLRDLKAWIRDKTPRSLDGMTVFFLTALVATVLVGAIFMLTPSGTVHIVYGRYNDNIMGPFLLLGFLELLERKDSPVRNALYGVALLLCALGVKKSLEWFSVGGHAQVNCAGISRFVTATEIKLWPLVFLAGLCFLILLALREIRIKGKQVVWLPVLACAVAWVCIGLDSAHAFNQTFGDWPKAPSDTGCCVEAILNYERQTGEDATIYAVQGATDFPQRYIGNGIQFAMPRQDVRYIAVDDVTEISEEYYVVVTVRTEQNIEGLRPIYQGKIYEVWVPEETQGSG